MIFEHRFDGQTAVITGGAQGIGKAIAQRLAAEGARIGILDFDKEKTKATASELNAIPLVCDITDDAAVQSALSSFHSATGQLDIVVHSAAVVGPTGTTMNDVSTEEFEKVCRINLVGSFSVTHHALNLMKPRDYGRILIIASIAGKEGNAGMSCYSATKAGVIGLVKAAGKEFAETGITVNALAPAVIRTAMVEAMPEAQVKYMTDKIPAKRCGTLDEAAAIATWIVSKEAGFNTGFTFDLSGGRAVY